MLKIKDLKIAFLMVSIYNQNSPFLGMFKEPLFPFSQKVSFALKKSCVDKKLNDKARRFSSF